LLFITVTADPAERVDFSKRLPDVVKKLSDSITNRRLSLPETNPVIRGQKKWRQWREMVNGAKTVLRIIVFVRG